LINQITTIKSSAYNYSSFEGLTPWLFSSLKNLMDFLEGPIEIIPFDNQRGSKPDNMFMGFFAEEPLFS